jgi:hypothetical protein
VITRGGFVARLIEEYTEDEIEAASCASLCIVRDERSTPPGSP